MRVINVVKINEGVVDDITSFGVFEEQLSQEVVEKAEADFVAKAKEIGFDPELREIEETEDDLITELLDFGFYESKSENKSVCISWSDI